MYWDVPLARASPKLPPCPSEWWLPESSASLLSMTLRGATWSVARAERIALLGWGGWLPFLDGAAGCHLGWHGWSRGLPSSSGEATPLLTCSLIGPRWRTKLSYRRGSVGCYVAVAQPPPRRWQRTCTGGGTRWNAFGTRDVRGALMWTPMGTRHITVRRYVWTFRVGVVAGAGGRCGRLYLSRVKRMEHPTSKPQACCVERRMYRMTRTERVATRMYVLYMVKIKVFTL